MRSFSSLTFVQRPWRATQRTLLLGEGRHFPMGDVLSPCLKVYLFGIWADMGPNRLEALARVCLVLSCPVIASFWPFQYWRKGLTFLAGIKETTPEVIVTSGDRRLQMSKYEKIVWEPAEPTHTTQMSVHLNNIEIHPPQSPSLLPVFPRTCHLCLYSSRADCVVCIYASSGHLCVRNAAHSPQQYNSRA